MSEKREKTKENNCAQPSAVQTLAPTQSANAFELATTEYSDFRPDYPITSVLAALLGTSQLPPEISENLDLTAVNLPNELRHRLKELVVADIGAGTGKFTAQLGALVKKITAIEPAQAMREQCQTHLESQLPITSNWGVTCGTGETTGLATSSQDVLTYAQCWHWMDVEKTVAEASRVLKPGGHLAIIFNQMDVTIPWVQRLTRIMRAGDIQSPEKPPRLSVNQHLSEGSYPSGISEHNFSDLILHTAQFSTPLSVEAVLGLARTRASYLRASEETRRRMQENLRWYLRDHLGYSPNETISIPYYTLTWIAYRK